MPKLKLLTSSQKLKIRDLLVQRDGISCPYCKQDIDSQNCEIDHLDDNPYNNEFYNFALCHSGCNKAKRNNFDYKIIASEKINLNKLITSINPVEITEPENSPEIEHNINVYGFVKQILTERVNTDGEIEYSDALNGFTYLASEKFEHCSQTTMRKHLDILTSFTAPFMITKNNKGKKVIVRRIGN